MDPANFDTLQKTFRRLSHFAPAAAADHVRGLGPADHQALTAAAAAYEASDAAQQAPSEAPAAKVANEAGPADEAPEK